MVWDLQTGRQLDSETDRMGERKDYTLLTSKDLRIEPEISRWTMVGRGSHRLSYLRAGWPTNLLVLLDGQHLWWPNLHQRADTSDWANSVQVQSSAETVHLGDAMRLTVSGIAPDVDLRFVRVGTITPAFVRRRGSADLAPIKVSADLAIFGGRVTLGLAKGKTTYLSRQNLPLRILGAVRKMDGVWERIDSLKPITKYEASTFPIRLCIPESEWQKDGSRHLTIMEGVTTWQSVSKRPGPLTGLAGYGDSLTVHCGPYDSEESLIIKIARYVIDPGIMRSSQIQTDGTILIDLRPEGYEPSSAHVVVIWQEGFNPQVVSGSAVTRIGTFQWRIRTKVFRDLDTAVGIAYQGWRIGSHWPSRGSNLLGTIPDGPLKGDPVTAAALARWLHLPLLDPGYLQPARQLLDKAPLHTLYAWIGNKGLPSGLKHTPIDPPWLAVVRRISRDWWPDASQANALCRVFAPDSEGDPCVAAIPVLAEVNPLLLGKVLLAHFNDSDTVYGKPERQHLRNKQSELFQSTMQDVTRMDDLTQAALTTLQQSVLPARQRLNLRVALHSEGYRQYLAGQVIGEVLRRIERRR